MLVRICLIIALVGGLVAAGVGGYFARNAFLQTLSERDQAITDRDDFHHKFDDTTKKLTAATKELTDTKAKLAQTQTDLQNATAQVDDLNKQNTQLTADLKRARDERDTADQELDQWHQIQLKPSEVKALIADFEKAKQTIAAKDEENKILLASRNDYRDRYNALVGTDTVPELPPGLVGHVVAVDPKFGFVILDIGQDKGVLKRGQMMVDRDGRMVGKIQITRVDKDKSVANVMPQFSRGEIMEGDVVID